jgi:nuclear autoantigenic sperm protein
MDPVKEAWNHILQGKRHLVVRDYSTAVQSLEDGCKLLDQVYGVNADECADAYFYYGLALFELARQETGALNGVGDVEQSEEEEEGDQVEDDGQEEEEEEEEEEEAAADQMPSSSGVIGRADFEEDITRSPHASNGQDADAGDMMMDDMDLHQPSTSSGLTDADREAAIDEDDDSNVSTIEIAWEVLKLAKNVYQRQLNYKEGVHLNLAETVQKLGEIYIEWENFEEALNELNFCLQIRQQQLAPDNRLIAET